MNKTTPQKSLNKFLWLTAISLMAVVAWFVLYAGITVMSGNYNTTNYTWSIVYTSAVFTSLSTVYWLIFRKHKRTLLRWTAKSLLIVSPLAILCSAGLASLTYILASSAQQVDQPTASNTRQDQSTPTYDSEPSIRDEQKVNGSTSSGTTQKCEVFTIYMDYKYKNDPNMYTYEQRVDQGRNGKERICYTNGQKSSQVIEAMISQVTYTGSKTPSNPYSPANPNPQKPDYSQCNQFAGTGAYQACVDAINGR